MYNPLSDKDLATLIFSKKSFTRSSFRKNTFSDPLFEEFGSVRFYQGDFFDSSKGRWVAIQPNKKRGKK